MPPGLNSTNTASSSQNAVVLFEEQQHKSKGCFANDDMADGDDFEDVEDAEGSPAEAFLSAEPMELDFGAVYLGQVCGPLTVEIKSSSLQDVSISSSLFSIIYFEGGQQEIEDISAF